jgi:lysozyme
MGTLLSPADRQALVNSVAKHEGFRAHPYLDCCGRPWKDCGCPYDKKGNLTIGFGRNLDANGISKKEAAFLLQNDLDTAEAECRRAFAPWFGKLAESRAIVLIEMAFNMGLKRLSGFGQSLKAIREGRYDDAAKHLLKSRWAEQVGQRAQTLAEQMREG